LLLEGELDQPGLINPTKLLAETAVARAMGAA